MVKIDSYKFGKIVVGGERYDEDIVILPDGMVELREPTKGKHKITAKELARICGSQAEVVLIGTGAYGRAGLTKRAESRKGSPQCSPLIMTTPAAVDQFNREVSRGASVAALLHITC